MVVYIHPQIASEIICNKMKSMNPTQILKHIKAPTIIQPPSWNPHPELPILMLLTGAMYTPSYNRSNLNPSPWLYNYFHIGIPLCEILIHISRDCHILIKQPFPWKSITTAAIYPSPQPELNQHITTDMQPFWLKSIAIQCPLFYSHNPIALRITSIQLIFCFYFWGSVI